jgi:hypothetical protein
MRIISRALLSPTLVNANVATMQIFPRLDDATKAYILQLAGAGKGSVVNKRFIVRASGRITTATATNVTLTLQSGTSLVSGNNATMKASTARACNTASCPWWLQAELIFDHTSGLLHGVAEFLVNNLYDAKAAITAVANITDASVDPLANMVAGVTFSANDPGNKAFIDEFVYGF